MAKNRVLLGMSGGTDSSVSAMILKEKGFEVIGVTFLFADSEINNISVIKDSAALAERLNLNHHIIDLRKEFEDKIIRKFEHEYLSGRTPFPCAFCNPDLKFKYLKHHADNFNCQFIATGHYSNVTEFEGIKYISKGIDEEKDQSFFLWGLQSEIIDRLIFPLGNWNKANVRKFAKQKGFEKVSKKKDSLGICFIEGNNYRKWLLARGIKSEKGNFTDQNGNILGTHNGIINYTVGQRHGLGVNTDRRLFVAEIKTEDNSIVLSEYEYLFRKKIYIRNINFVDYKHISDEKIYIVKIRYRLQETPCQIKIMDKNRAIIELKEPVAMVAKGQAAVLYGNERIIGGGFIDASE